MVNRENITVSCVVVLFMFFLVSPQIALGNRDLKTIKGLEYTNISSIAQDEDGLMWIGTTKGLYSYDGYNLRKIIIDNESGEFNIVTDLCFMGEYLFIVTRGGLKILNSNTKEIENFSCPINLEYLLSIKYLDKISEHIICVFLPDSLEVLSIDTQSKAIEKVFVSDISDDIIKSRINIAACDKGVFLCGDHYLYQYIAKDGKLMQVNKYSYSELIGGADKICCIKYVNHFMYIRTLSGVYQFSFNSDNSLSVKSRKYLCFSKFNSKAPIFSKGIFQVDPVKGTLYCKYDDGIIRVDSPFDKSPIVLIYSTSFDSDVVIPTDFINSLYIDKSCNLWLLTRDYGLLYTSLTETPFLSIEIPHIYGIYNYNNYITGIAEDAGMNVWISTHLGDLYVYKNNKFDHVPEINVESIQAIKLNAETNELYIALPYGLIIYDIKSKQYENIVGPYGLYVQESLNITALEIDALGNIWFGTWNKGLYCITKKGDSYRMLHHIKSCGSINEGKNEFSWVSQIFSDNKSNQILVCTDNGLLRVTMQRDGTLSMILYNTHQGNSPGLKSNFVNCIDKECDDIYWIGTSGGGFGRVEFLNNDTEIPACNITSYGLEDGYKMENVEQILVGKKGRIWVGTDFISCFNYKSGEIQVYDNASTKPMASSVCFKGKKYYMSGRKLVIFDDVDSKIRKSNKVKLLDIYIHNSLVTPNKCYEGKLILNDRLNNTSRIVLSHSQRNFSITFSSLDYTPLNNIKYRYKLSGFEREWHINEGENNRADYSNIPYGKYEFMLQISCDNGLNWSDSTKKLTVIVDAPWWWSWWSVIFYILASLTVITSLIYLAVSKMKVKRQLIIKSLEKQKNEEVNQLRMRFFTNISHEFKTPLTLICIAVEELEKKISLPDFDIVRHNTKLLLRLITELIDFRKSDLGIDQLDLSYNSICQQVESIYSEMNIWARNKNISFTLSFDKDLFLYYDKKKFEHIIRNLFSNAIKNVDEGGLVQVEIKKHSFTDIKYKYRDSYFESNLIDTNEETCLISVIDTGVGISSESISKIFKRYFQLNYKTDNHLGSGIGLALVKNWVLLHKGAVGVSSERNSGTEIIISIPFNLEPKKNEYPVVNSSSDILVEPDFDECACVLENKGLDDCSERPVILIVEDSDMLREQMKAHFMQKYTIISAKNGKEGYRLCEDNYPDLIITDVMMPIMSGIEMCQKIRENLKIAYIPIIILTAKSEINDQIEGYESGADMFIPKPFSFKLLDINVARILSYHLNTVHDELGKLDRPDEFEGEEENNHSFSAKDTAFMKKLDSFILSNIDRSDFSVNDICLEVAMGKTKLYTRIKDVYGVSLGELIKDARLDRAGYLLLNSEMQINEIAYAVGYETNSHFSKIFKIKHGMTPSEYIKKKNNL